MKYEYKVITTPKLTETHLNELGSDGWEHYHVEGYTHYFKREVDKEAVRAAPIAVSVNHPSKQEVNKKKK